MRVLAAEVKDAGVRVLSVDPGEMDTQMHRDAMPEADPATLARPAAVAERVIAALDDETRAPTGARVLAAQWVTA